MADHGLVPTPGVTVAKPYWKHDAHYYPTPGQIVGVHTEVNTRG